MALLRSLRKRYSQSWLKLPGVPGSMEVEAVIPLIKNEPIKLYIIKARRGYAGAASRFCLAVTGPTIKHVQARMLALIITTFRAIEMNLPGEITLETPEDLLVPFRKRGSKEFTLTIAEVTQAPCRLELLPGMEKVSGADRKRTSTQLDPTARVFASLARWSESGEAGGMSLASAA